MTNADDKRRTYTPSKDAVTLSPDARDIARASGMSEVEYARLVLELRRRKKAGLYQDG